MKIEPASSLYESIFDGTHDTPKPVKAGKPLVTSKHIKNASIDFSTTYSISQSDYEKINKRSKVEQWDVIISMIGAYCGFCYIEREPKIDYAIKNVGVFRTGGQLEAEWLYYYLNSKFGKAHLEKVRGGSSQPYLSLGALRSLPIYSPKRELKEPIVKVISGLYQKIELNNRINAELEAMAKQLYDYWFVQFDFPMTAQQAAALGQPELEGQPYKSSGGPMVYNERLKREIPEGWSVKSLGAFENRIITGKTPSTAIPENFGGKIPFICIGDVRGNMHVVKTELTLSELGANSQKKKYIPKGAICVTCIASPGLIAFATEDSQTNQQLNSVICQKEEHRAFLYFELKKYFNFSSGAKTGNTFANMNKADFSAIPVLDPTNSLLRQFAQRVAPNLSLNLNNGKQNQELAELRDWLLPMLMNGQVTVREAEAEVAKV